MPAAVRAAAPDFLRVFAASRLSRRGGHRDGEPSNSSLGPSLRAGAVRQAGELASQLGGGLVVYNGASRAWVARLTVGGPTRVRLNPRDVAVCAASRLDASTPGRPSPRRDAGFDFLTRPGGGGRSTLRIRCGLLAHGVSSLTPEVAQGQRSEAAVPLDGDPHHSRHGRGNADAVVVFPKEVQASIRSDLSFRASPWSTRITRERPASAPAARHGALCQERVLPVRGANPMTDSLAQPARASNRSPAAGVHDGCNLTRRGMALAALWSGITLSSAGLGAVHGFAARSSPTSPPPGVVCAALLRT